MDGELLQKVSNSVLTSAERPSNPWSTSSKTVGHCDHLLQALDLPNPRHERDGVRIFPILVDCERCDHDPSRILHLPGSNPRPLLHWPAGWSHLLGDILFWMAQ